MDGSYGNHVVGEKFQNKELLSHLGKNQHNHHLWKWRCLLCDTEHGPSTIAHIKRSDRCKSCIGENHGSWKGYKEITGVFLYQYQWDAKRKSRDWLVTPEQLWTQWVAQQGLCVYSGLMLTHGQDASIDRIDSFLGYIDGNVQWVHKDINRMKSDFSEQYFVSMCQAVARNNK